MKKMHNNQLTVFKIKCLTLNWASNWFFSIVSNTMSTTISDLNNWYGVFFIQPGRGGFNEILNYK